ncbi:MAG: MBL fold metallo-hydrolase [Gammaproteobacteria bacterium]|nr:MBL fold metallo-hydrolase [Gammaproteobacteria bacterium]
MIQTLAPDLSTAEISIFGPGVGECAVIHFGNGRWFIVDSCLSPESKKPIALEYLNSIGVDVATQVHGILVSHWHKDHIEGLYQLVKACEKAVVHASAALFDKEALQLASLYKKVPFNDTDKEIREFREVVEHLHNKKQHNRFDIVHAKHLFFEDRIINTRLVALSPSSVAVTQAIERIRELKPKEGGRRVHLVAPSSENLNAVAMHFSFGEFSAVLGSDLEYSDNVLVGWQAVLDSKISEHLSLGKAKVYKVAHHGSKSGHHLGIWEQLLEQRPQAITTPYANSYLPKSEDINRIISLASSFIVTRDPTPKSKIKHDPMTDRWLKKQIKNRHVINDKIGHAQIRITVDGEYQVEKSPICVEYREVG